MRIFIGLYFEAGESIDNGIFVLLTTT